MHGFAGFAQQARCFAVEGGQLLAAQLPSAESDHAISEIAAPCEQLEPGCHGRSIGHHAAAGKQRFDGADAVVVGEAVDTAQHPNQFAQHREGDRHKLRLLQQRTG